MDNLTIVTRRHGPLTVTVLATAGAKSNAIRTGVDEGSHIEGEEPAGTINIMVLSNIALSDAALARALITITEGKTAALEDLKVPSSYTKDVQATGTGTDSIIVVSGTATPRATYTGGHSRIGELIGKATYQAVSRRWASRTALLPAGRPTFWRCTAGLAKKAGDLRLALLHLDAVPGDIAGNRTRIENAIREAVRQGADWVVTPETGRNRLQLRLAHRHRLGCRRFPGAWINTLAAMARDNRVALFVGFAERDAGNRQAAQQRRRDRPHGPGTRRLSQAARAWRCRSVVAGRHGRADLHGRRHCRRHADLRRCLGCRNPPPNSPARGAKILLSPANWPPVDSMGPGDVWERRSRETGIPMVVVNRGGKEPELDFSLARKRRLAQGQTAAYFTAASGGIFYVDWDRSSASAPFAPTENKG